MSEREELVKGMERVVNRLIACYGIDSKEANTARAAIAALTAQPQGEPTLHGAENYSCPSCGKNYTAPPSGVREELRVGTIGHVSPSSRIVQMADAAKAITRAAEQVNAEGQQVALNVNHKDCHKAADAFWQYWRENGVTHKHGYYESTWGAINQALRYVGVVPHEYGKPRIEVTGTTHLGDCIAATPAE